jgi:hypothetical protein
MKYISTIPGFFLIATLAIACHQSLQRDDSRQTIDSLGNLIQLLKPGLGEFMVQLEFHEERLSKSIMDKNYERAGFEIDEIAEVAEKVEQLRISNDKLKQPFSEFYHKYLNSPLNDLKGAAEKKDDAALKSGLVSLVNNCNSCHQENSMGFLKINY